MAKIKIGAIGPHVKELQESLTALGYDTKGIDGIFGKNTEKALKDFQKDFFTTGIADEITLLAIDSAENALGQKQINESQIRQIAQNYDIEYPLLRAVMEVESLNEGFLPSGKPVILFERHIFWQSLSRIGINPALINQPDICNIRPGGYVGGELEHTRLEKAIRIDRECAYRSASWGLGQVMGFNFALAGYRDIESFVTDMSKSELLQFRAMVEFIKRTSLILPLKNKNWRAFAQGYNGLGYEQNNYHTKLEKAYEKWSKQ